MHIEKLKKMFEEMVIKKDTSLISVYYHRDFMLYTNEQIMDYDTFLKVHHEYYATPIEYDFTYDEETWVEQGEKIAGRVWVTTSHPNEAAKKIEVIFIVEFKDQKIYRMWELTYPDWPSLPAFKQ